MRKIVLSLSDKLALEQALTSEKGAVLPPRIHCILLSSNLGLTVSQLSQHFGVTRKTIYQWFTLWEQGGLASLRHRKGQGAKRKLASISAEELGELLMAHHQNIKSVLAILASKYSIEVSKKTLIRFFKRERIHVAQGS